jgi:hypothetical protein
MPPFVSKKKKIWVWYQCLHSCADIVADQILKFIYCFHSDVMF